MGNETTETSSATRFGALLQEFRKRSSYTQSELSGFSTVSVRAIRNLELGQAKNPRRETVRLLSDALRLGGEQRAALQLAAGLGVHDVAFDDLPPLPHAGARPLRGREAEEARLLRLFRAEGERLAVITGLGGVGKSRLALAVARALQAEDGLATLWWSLPDPARRDGVGGGDARGRRERTGAPPLAGLDGLLAAHGGSAADAVRLIGDRPVLLVLDGNDGHDGHDGHGTYGASDGAGTHGGPGPRGAHGPYGGGGPYDGDGAGGAYGRGGGRPIAAGTLRALLDGCRGLRILQTSRTVRDGRWPGFRLPLHPLPVPALNAVEDLQRVEAAPAVAVLLDRLADLQAGFRLDRGNAADLLEICAQLDGLPRALESAASWLVVSSAAELVHLARTEPQVPARAVNGGGDADWVTRALDDALAALDPADTGLLAEAARWETPWSVGQFADELGIGRVRAATAVHAYLQCGLVRRMPSAHHVVFGVVHVMRAPLLDRLARDDRRGRPTEGHPTSEGNEEKSHEAGNSDRTARGLGAAADLLRGRPGRGDAA
ncbi:helix-turn-helix domain-containing protein [Streptomyces sp. NPDC035033]|uniref:helix-turn-helix domain-containing protein n=1 Tax=Streptomyces sp. NPDC035033 TaxID=3155368 RepID=UPI0033D858DC